MAYNDNKITRGSQDSEQIDLIDLFIQLWRGKWIIALFIIIAVVIAGAYVTFAKEKWTSTAIITMPDVGQIAGYTNAATILYGDAKVDVSEIQQRVITRFSGSFSALTETLKNQEEPEKLTIDTAVKGQPLPLQVTYQAESVEGAQHGLAKYIQQVDEQIADELDQDLAVNIKSRTDELQASLATQEKIATEQKALRIKQITQALTVANESNIKAPQAQQNDNLTQDNLFLLGSTALESMVKNESSRPLVFSDQYYKTKQNLLDIQRIKPDPANMHAYRYVMKPTQPLYRDSPKRTLILLVAILLGGMIGAGVVLVRNALRHYQPRA
ncbi:LPS O-antigen chain length determinant protein WzzB [Enterobacter sp.]|uniref:LPS O-antigen chain length determinant protein WzzB n=1 Tax=Enterobacter sp. TaxID=42895 RepID=UPI002981BC58|nr:LPS O-antigen chain length determinant protein WzzB [Enterobacter sp.]